MRPLGLLLVALLEAPSVFSQLPGPPPPEVQEEPEAGTETAPAAEGPRIAPPPDGILPVAEVRRLDYGPRDRPHVEIEADRLLVSTASGLVESHDALSGELSWKLGLPGETFFPPLVRSPDPLELLLASPSGHLVRVRGDNGEILQELTLGSPSAVAPLLLASTIFVGAPTGEVIAFDLETGSERFKLETGEAPAALALGEGLLVVSGSERTLTAVDVDRGTVRWTLHGRSGFHAPAAFGEKGDKLYVGDDSGDFYCLSTENGKTRFRWSTGASIRARPLVEGERVYVTSYANNLYAYDASGGSERWRVSLPGRPASPVLRIYHRLLVATFDGVLVEVDPEKGEIGKSWTAPGEIASAPALLVAAPAPTALETEKEAEAPANPDEKPAGAEPPEPPKWFENHRIALPLRSGEVLLLGYKPPEATPEKPGPGEQKAPTENKDSRRPKGTVLSRK